MPGAVTNKKNLYLCKSVDEIHKLSEVKPLTNNVNIIIRSASKVFQDAEKLDKEGDEEKALVLFMKYFNILKQVKSKADYKKQKEFFDNLIGRKNQLKAIERAEVLNESLRERYDFQKAQLLAQKLSPIESPPETKVTPKAAEKSTNIINTQNKVEVRDKESKSGVLTCMQLCSLLRDRDSNLILMDIRSADDFSQSHISHSHCISVPEEYIAPGSTVNHIEAKLAQESKMIWETRKNADHIIIIDWKSKTEDVKIGTPIQTLKDALFKFDINVIIKSEPVVLEGGYEAWLTFYPTMTTNPHVAIPHQSEGTDRAPSPTLLLDFDYPELDENLKVKIKEPIVLSKVVTESEPGKNNTESPSVPKVDRSLKPSVNGKQQISGSGPASIVENNSDFSSGDHTAKPVDNNNVYPSLMTSHATTKVSNSAASIINSSSAGPKPIDLSVKNNLFVNKSNLKDHKSADESSNGKNNVRIQEEIEKTEEVEAKLKELDLLKKKKEKDLADLMRKERKIKEDIERQRQEEDARLLEIEDKKKAISEQQRKEEEERDRMQTVDSLRAERKKEEMLKKQKEEEEKKEAEKEALMKKQEEQRERELELQRLEEQKKIEQEEEEKIAQEMTQLEIAKTERLKAEQHKIEEERQREVERHKELARIAEERKKKEQKEKEAMEEARQAKEAEEKRKQAELKKREAKDESSKNHSSLPPGWERRLDQATKRYYYIDHHRGVTTWEAPTANTASGTFTTKLKEEPTLSRGLSRSHSSPNIVKELAEEERAEAKKPPLVVDRANKPTPAPVKRNVQPMFSMRKRDLNPVYGNVIQGMTGLRNLGNTCYMNSTVQCLSNTSPFIAYFLSDNFHRDINRESSEGMHGEVVDDFSIVIKALWSGQYRSITPRDLKSTVGKYNPMFSGYQQQDSQEFLTFLLDGLHEGLNEVKRPPDIPEQNNDNLSDDRAARLAWEHHKLLHKSIIVELFQGQLKSTLMCRTCKKKSVTFQAFMFLSLPIPASSRCLLRDCVQEFLKPEMMTGSCKWKCPRCKVERDSEKKIDIWKLPPILLIGLNRFYSEGMWMQKKTTYVDFPVTDFDLSPYILGPAPRNTYNLYGISNHYGTMEGGHYTAFCRNPVTTKWCKFDDQDVTEISKSDIKTSAAFVLYYTSIEMPAPQYRIGF